MLIGLLHDLGIIFYNTWFIWPFVLIFSLTYGLVSIIKSEERSIKGIVSIVISGISILIILSGFFGPYMSY